MTLPKEKVSNLAQCNGNDQVDYYDDSKFDDEFNAIPVARKYPGAEWTVERKPVVVPGGARRVIRGIMPNRWFDRMKLGPNGRIWGITYFDYMDNGYSNEPGTRVTFIVSDDNGETYQYLSDIPFQPDTRYVLAYERHDPRIFSFTEADIEFLSNGTIVCIIRSQDFAFPMPTYICYSYDNGRTWTKPKFFDVLGVFPRMLRLNCGVILATYGRPGVYIRATDDQEAREWQEPLAIVEPDARGNIITCSNSTLVAIDDNTAMLAYSSFYYPDEKGEPHKTILCRTITIE